MALNLLQDKGTPLDRQRFTWKELVQTPISKLDDDAFTRVRIILMNGIEMGRCVSSINLPGTTTRYGSRWHKYGASNTFKPI